MALSIQVFIQVALWLCVVTTGMGGITDWEKGFSQLEKKNEGFTRRNEVTSPDHTTFGGETTNT